MARALDRLTDALEATPLVRYLDGFVRGHPDLHMKDQVVEATGPDRLVRMNGRWVVNFGSDSFLGLDRDPRLAEAVRRGLDRWGTHNGSSRAFSSVAANVEAERKLADWMKAESSLIFPSVTLANHGVLSALATRRDAVVADQFAHHSVQTGVKLVAAGGGKTATFAHNDPADLERQLKRLRPYRSAVVAVDGLYSMTGTLPRLREFREIAAANDAVLYVDDAHATGVLGEQGRGTVLDALGDYDDVLVVGSLSKALSCFGGFLACSERVRRIVAYRSGPFIFGGPVPPAYLDAVCAAVDILQSDEYPRLIDRLTGNMWRLRAGLAAHGLAVTGGVGAIASVPVGETMDTLRAGRALFDAGYYVQSVVFPAVPHRGGLLRIQVNANHPPEAVDGLVAAVGKLGIVGEPLTRTG
jgi:7-keto-8-aminopelargonate synthetase-like enzyme